MNKIRHDAVVCESVTEFSDNLSWIAGQPMILEHNFSLQRYWKYQRKLCIWTIYQRCSSLSRGQRSSLLSLLEYTTLSLDKVLDVA